ncbi:MAG: sulfite exporter TauE/SafE family protein [Methyloceanibacter sp.]|uniref:sulfite exporter TauE/SafE family protein n=1 Tax=Methyloceanibacter sp. TaxID=1965321 RepID=UPI003D9AEA69
MVDLGWVAALLPLIAAGFGVGFLIGMTGVGGGALMTPLLISTFGVSPQVAVGTDLLYAAVTKTVGGWRHHVADHVEWPVVLRLAAGSIPASILLLAAMAFLPLNTVALAHWIRYGLAFALPISALAIVLYPVLIQTPERTAYGKMPLRTFPTVSFGVVLGLLVTLTSVGAGAIGVVVLATLFPLLPAKRIVGTDIAHAVPLTFVGGFGHLGLGHVEFGLLLALLCGSIPGILLGTRLAGVAPEWLLRPILAITLCYAAYSLFNR